MTTPERAGGNRYRRIRDGGRGRDLAAHLSPGNGELQPVVSIAIDPKDSRIIYAGTPHLPWKTLDAGEHWASIHTGMIDDSDVFSILVDRNRPQRVFATACSGIYRSVNSGGNWTRLPEARDASFRTYVLAQDPQRKILNTRTYSSPARPTGWSGRGMEARRGRESSRCDALDCVRHGAARAALHRDRPARHPAQRRQRQVVEARQ